MSLSSVFSITPLLNLLIGILSPTLTCILGFVIQSLVLPPLLKSILSLREPLELLLIIWEASNTLISLKASIGSGIQAGGGGGTLHIRASKTLQFQQRSLTIPLPGIPGSPLCPVAALQSHLRFSSGHAHSPLFSVISVTSQRLIPITYRHFVLFFLQPSARSF